jgi:hypothetical protein
MWCRNRKSTGGRGPFSPKMQKKIKTRMAYSTREPSEPKPTTSLVVSAAVFATGFSTSNRERVPVPPVDFRFFAPHNFFTCIITISKYDIRDLRGKIEQIKISKKTKKFIEMPSLLVAPLFILYE